MKTVQESPTPPPPPKMHEQFPMNIYAISTETRLNISVLEHFEMFIFYSYSFHIVSLAVILKACSHQN